MAKNIDYDAIHTEVAMRILQAHQSRVMTDTDEKWHQKQVAIAFQYADEFVKQLKERNKK